jgi:Effector-associated domain 10/NACHT domain
MSDDRDLDAIFDRIANGTATEEDIQTLRQSIRERKGQNVIQLGKYSVNIGEGRDIHIGDKIYQSTDAQTIRAILLEILADKDLIDKTFQRLFPPSASSAVDWDWGMKLLNQKQLPEIRKRLSDTLGHDRIFMDISIEERQTWVNRSRSIDRSKLPLSADRTLQIDGRDCGTLDPNKMLIETFGRDDIEGKLLILGAPGAGKTTALLSLAEQLVEGAISLQGTVIPVIFELSTWQNDNQSIHAWLIEQLYELHGGDRKIYQHWLNREVLLPLFDGLDELGLERQKKCTEKLDRFASYYPQMVVCCRVKEFETVGVKLKNLRGAVCLQSLSDLQIQHYLNSVGHSQLSGEILTTSSLQALLAPTIEGDSGLLRVPLFLKLLVDTYNPSQPISSKADLLDKYIDRQLSFDRREIDRRKELKKSQWAFKTANLEPDWRKTRSTLSWLARNLQANNTVDFTIEQLQPSSIEPLQLQRRYLLFFGIITGVLFAILDLINYLVNTNYLFNVTPSDWSINVVIFSLIKILEFPLVFTVIKKSNNGLINGLIGAIIIEFFHTLFRLAISTLDSPLSEDNLLQELNRLFYSAVGEGMFYWIVIGLINEVVKIEPVETFQLSMQNAIKNLNIRLILIIIAITIFVIIVSSFPVVALIVVPLSPTIIFKISRLSEDERIKRLPSQSSPDIQVLQYFLYVVFIVLIYTFLDAVYLVLIYTLLAILINWLVRGLIGGLKKELKNRLYPNQGIWNSLRNQIFITIIIFDVITAISILFFSLKNWPFFSFKEWGEKLFISLIFGFCVGGGKAVLQHLSLRIVLWQSGLPWNFARFLNYCVERRLLLRVGGSYRFLHRELRDHFAPSTHSNNS